MPPFLHLRLQRIESLLHSADDALRASTERSLSAVDVAVAHLADAGTVYADLGIPDAANQMIGLSAQMAEARSGINPLTLERVSTHRREMERTVALYAVQTSSARLRTDYSDVRRSLDALRAGVSPLALYALQQGMVPSAPDRSLTQDELEVVWKALCDDPESRSAARQIMANAARTDVLLVLGDLLESAR
jgi:hypothetical protein